jgi:hypothetical protein
MMSCWILDCDLYKQHRRSRRELYLTNPRYLNTLSLATKQDLIQPDHFRNTIYPRACESSE